MELKYEELSLQDRAMLRAALKMFAGYYVADGDGGQAQADRATALADDIDIGIAKILYAPAHVWRETRIGAKPD